MLAAPPRCACFWFLPGRLQLSQTSAVGFESRCPLGARPAQGLYYQPRKLQLRLLSRWPRTEALLIFRRLAPAALASPPRAEAEPPEHPRCKQRGLASSPHFEAGSYKSLNPNMSGLELLRFLLLLLLSLLVDQGKGLFPLSVTALQEPESRCLRQGWNKGARIACYAKRRMQGTKLWPRQPCAALRAGNLLRLLESAATDHRIL